MNHLPTETPMTYSKTYVRFIQDDFTLIEREFNNLGYDIEDETDFDTYRGWINRGRQVNRGEKGINLESTEKYCQPIWKHGVIEVDLKTKKPKFAKWRKRYSLFHKTQTTAIQPAHYAPAY